MTAISWKKPVSGQWSNPANKSGHAVPGSSDDVTIGTAGAYTVAVTTNEAVDNLTLSDPDAKLVVKNAVLTVNGGIDGGTIDLTGSGDLTSIHGGVLVVTAGTTIDNETIDLGGSIYHSEESSFLYKIDPTDSAAVAIFGTGSNTVQTGLYVTLGAPNDASSAGTENDGTINGDYHSSSQQPGVLSVTSSVFINGTTGVINVRNNDIICVFSESFDNKCTINVTQGTELIPHSDWIDTGMISVTVTGATAVLGGSFTTAALTNIAYEQLQESGRVAA